ncbi:ABC transporter permease [Arachidicoccus ginsenosidimutans]|nr:ABC transporter permease [Arachidicoccus sp. BS20]
MIAHYLKTAWRNLFRNKTFSVINIGGLAVGMAVALLIGLWIYSEVSFNTSFKNYNTIAQVLQNQTVEGKIYTQQADPFPLGKALQTKYGSDFKHVIMSSWQGDHVLNLGMKNIIKSGAYMDKGADDMLSLKMLKGRYGALSQPNDVYISASTAKALFGNADPMNKQLKIDNKLDVKVAGVYEDIPYNTDFSGLDFIAPWDLYVTSESWIKNNQTRWDNNSFRVFVQMADHTDMQEVSKKIADIKLNEVSAGEKKYHAQMFLAPMKDWHLHDNYENGVQTGGKIVYVWMFGIIGMFVLLLACINFMNLSTARSEKRAKEVGIRKVVGSLRSMLIKQFYFESILMVVIAFAIALLLTRLTLPWFNTLSDKRMIIPWGNVFFWLTSVIFILFTGIIAGSYPALYLSSFNPVKVLKGSFRAGRNASLPRKILIISQFTISLILIIGTLVVYKQIKFSQNRPVGYNQNALIDMYVNTPEYAKYFSAIKNELLASGAITNMANSTAPVTNVWSSTNGLTWAGKDPNLTQDFVQTSVSTDFGNTVGWHITRGRDFYATGVSDSSSLIINEAAVKYMGLKNPVGTIIGDTYDSSVHYTVIGVVQDIVSGSAYTPVQQAFYVLNKYPSDIGLFYLRLNPSKSAHEAIETIGKVFKKYITEAPFTYNFVNEEYAQKFATEERIGKLATFFAALAVFISCLGLFGLASFMAEQRTKEIGIRKVLGASVFGLWKLLSKDFIVLVLISCAIAAPVAWLCMHKWLQKYEYRTAISWWVLAVPALFALAIALVTVSYHAIKAARANPVKSLKTE